MTRLIVIAVFGSKQRQWAVGQCTVLHCGALYYTLMHCSALLCTVLKCTALYCAVLHCCALCIAYTNLFHCTVYLVLYCTLQHCTALYCTVLNFTALTEGVEPPTMAPALYLIYFWLDLLSSYWIIRKQWEVEKMLFYKSQKNIYLFLPNMF